MISVIATLADTFDSLGLFIEGDAVDHILYSLANGIEPPFSKEEAILIASTIGIDPSKSKFDISDFQEGLRVEMEHGPRDPETDVIHHDYFKLGRIAWAHLKEDPDYYRKLAKIEKS